MGLLLFEKTPGEDVCKIHNTKEENIGWLERVRVGAWMSWVLFLNDGFYVSAGCMDEIRVKMRELNVNKKNG